MEDLSISPPPQQSRNHKGMYCICYLHVCICLYALIWGSDDYGDQTSLVDLAIQWGADEVEGADRSSFCRKHINGPSISMTSMINVRR